MKQFLKMNKVPLCIFLILLLWLCWAFFPKWNREIEHQKYMEEMQLKCREDMNYHKGCSFYINYKKEETSAFVEFSQIMYDKFSSLQIIASLIIIIAAVGKTHSKLKSGYFKNELLRMSYKDWFKEILKSTLSVIWILPVFVIIVFLLCLLKTGNLSLPPIPKCHDVMINGAIESMCTGDSFMYGAEKMVPIFPVFMIVFVLNIILNSIFYVNLSFIAIRKKQNMVVSIIVAYLGYIVFNIILEVFIGGLLFSKALGIHGITAFIGLSAYWVYENDFNIWFLVLYYIILVLSSFGIVKYLYRNKEEVIIENEK